MLPAGAGEADALRYLQDRHTLTLDQVTCAGDSGNDRDALLQGGFSLLMASAPESLVEEILRDARGLGVAHRIHLPGDPFADGAVEGCVASGGSGRRRGAPPSDTLEEAP